MDIEASLYHYGLGAGIPYRALNKLANAVDTARCYRSLDRRRAVARQITKGSTWAGFMPKDKGFARVNPDTLPGTMKAVEVARRIIAERRVTGWKTRAVNPVDHLELPEHFRDYPELLEYALSDAVLQIVSDYYGMVPQLKEVGIWVTREQKDIYNSQMYHLDKPETQIVGLFLNVETNDAEKGPFTFLPLDVSAKVRSRTDYDKIYFRGTGFLDDKAIFEHTSRDKELNAAGGPGTGIFVDTSNCLHFGSRCKSGERHMIMVKFMLPHKARKPRTPLFDLVPRPADEARRLALSGAAFARG